MTAIIGCDITICINYQKWVGPSIDTTDPSLGVSPLLGSGTIAFQ